ncbi:MAG: hypothetical protein PWR03_1579 [Tenuifilum sp.]|jgi:uncharacterized protein YebE (UPF0316 family)|uniref:UPF0316 protein FHG85_06930 n=1 Tax=Tenuifilum thalassicum TaxID=2590900 RepID=A0A7D4CR97_9BACT|nr:MULTISPECIES: DUF2179 domain-containing protein [Tenuifilum]MDI3527396.1 hypothetical protein [Tenuifilum sp.]QKG80005.1 DUF2179 domain-containing protein [Tenuifilum thalassicum]
MSSDFFSSDLYLYGVLPFLIFVARICDVTIGTLRIIYVSKGQRNIAPILGFFEVFIWIVAISQIMGNLNNWACYFGYAAGFAAGNYIGMMVEERLAFGKVLVRVFSINGGAELVKILNSHGYGATTFQAQGAQGDVSIVYSVINRKNLPDIQEILFKFNPKLFYVIEDIRKVNEGIFQTSTRAKIPIFGRWRKGK